MQPNSTNVRLRFRALHKYPPGTLCVIPECGRPVLARGWCKNHYQRNFTNGDPTITWRINDPVLRLATYGRWDGECFVWTRHRDRERGYGITSSKRKLVKVHRLQWEIANGPIPDGLEVCHTCDNPPCYRLEHLFLGTHTENMHDMALKGRAGVTPRELQPGAKVTTAQVNEIVTLYSEGHSLRRLAAQFGISVTTVHRFVQRAAKSAPAQ